MVDIVGSTTVDDLWAYNVRVAPESPFLVAEQIDIGTSSYTYAEFDAEIIRTANLLARAGVRRGDCVGVHMANCPELLMCLFATMRLGAVCVPVNSEYLPAEARHIIRSCDIRVVVACPGALSYYCMHHQDDEDPAPISVEALFVVSGTEADEPAVGECGAVDFEQARLAEDPVMDVVPVDSNDVAEIMFTSGTTALPKGVMLTHANLVFSGHFVNWQASMRSQDRVLTTMPASHVNLQLSALMPVLTAGACLVLISRYSARRFWKQVRHYRATVIQSMAMILRTQLLQPIDEGERDHDVREVLYFLPVPQREKEAYEERFGVRLLNSYGSTESLVGVLTDPPHGERRWPSIGRVGLGYEGGIFRSDGSQAAVGEIGEIRLRGRVGRTLMLGYHGDPQASAQAIDEDGWLHTADLGWVDEDGWFFFAGRHTNFIKRAGENISPTEIENVLMSHPDVSEAVVKGVPDPIRDEAVKAFVVPTHGSTIDVEDLRRYCAERLASFKVPTIYAVVDSFPRGRYQKIRRDQLH